MMINPYQTPQTEVNDVTHQLDYDELTAFVSGSNSLGDKDYYLRKWHGLLNNTSNWTGFNFPSFFFGMVWCFYRKMYITGIVITVIEMLAAVAAGIVIFVLLEGIVSEETLTIYATVATFVLVRLPFGFLSNRLYLNRARKVVQKIKQLESENNRLEKIKKSGGVSVAGLLLGFIINTAIRFI